MIQIQDESDVGTEVQYNFGSERGEPIEPAGTMPSGAFVTVGHPATGPLGGRSRLRRFASVGTMVPASNQLNARALVERGIAQGKRGDVARGATCRRRHKAGQDR